MGKDINIGFDAKRLFTNRSGLGNYSRSLVKALSDNFPHVNLHLYTPKEETSEITAWLHSRHNIFIHQGRGPAALWRTKGVVSDLIRDNIDIYHGLSAELPIGLEKTQIKSVVTIHDCIFKVFPAYYSVVDRHIYNQKCKHAIAKADYIVSISEHTLRDIRTYFSARVISREDVTNVAVVPPIVKIADVSKIEKENFFIFIGTGNQRKNLITVLKALSVACKVDRRMKLVVVGTPGLLERNYIHKEKLDDYIEILTDIPSGQLYSLLAKSRALIYPTLYEGFGLPIVEALRLGTTVVTSSNSAIVEAGGNYVHYLNDSIDHIELADMMSRMIETPGSAIDYTGLNDHLQQFSPGIISARLMGIYKGLL